jgi:NitT/TauT family transport system substrate-binding protein
MGPKRLLAALAALLLASAPALARDRVTYGTASRVGLANAAMYMAEVMGFFRENEIDLTTVQFDGTGVLLPQIANGQITVGYPIPDLVILSHDTGRDPLPIQFFYNVTRQYNWEIVVLENSPIRTLADLRGKRIGVISLTTGNVPVTRAILREAGIDTQRGVEIIPVGQGAAAVNAFRNGQVDALNQFDVVHAQIAVAGTPIRRIPIPAKYRAISGNSFAAHTNTIRNNPDLLRRFGRAYTMGLVACEANPEACVRLSWQLHPTLRPTGGDQQQQLANQVRIMLGNLANKIPPGNVGARSWGDFSEEGWRTNMEILRENGQLRRTDVPLEAVYTNALVPEFGRFDVNAVIARARALQ